MSLHGTLISAHADHRPNVIHMPRTQREAGIDMKAWEHRLEPARSYLRILAEAFGIAAIVISLTILCFAVAG